MSIVAVSACSQDKPNFTAHHHNPALEKAIQTCHKTEGYDAMRNCLAQHGFQMPKKHPPMYHHSNPELAKAMQECHQGLKTKDDMPKFEACLKEKGFEKPTNHPKTTYPH